MFSKRERRFFIKHALLSFLLAIYLLTGFLSPAAAAPDDSSPKIVRTGYTLPDPNVANPDDVPRTGYIYEYQEMVASFNN